MEESYSNLVRSVKHLHALHEVFSEKSNFEREKDWETYNENYEELNKLISSSDIKLFNQLYNEKDRQMILADILEYIFMWEQGKFLEHQSKSALMRWNTKKRNAIPGTIALIWLNKSSDYF